MKIINCLLLVAVAGLVAPSATTGHSRTQVGIHAPVVVLRATQLGGNQINGHIFDTSRRPVGQIYVELMNDLYQTIRRTRTDDSGRFNFSNLPSGRFKLKVLVTGTDYDEQTQEVEINNFAHQTPNGPVFSRESREVDFYLKTKVESGSAFSGSPGVLFVQEVPEEAKKSYERGLQDLKSGKKDAEGLEEIKRAIELFPNYYLALDRLGTEYVKRGEYQAATILLSKAVEVFPKSYQSLHMLGVALWKLDRVDDALEMFERALRFSPNSINTEIALGTLLQQKKRYEQAESHLKRANKLSNNRVPDVHWQLALLYNHTKRNREAADELEQYLKLKPDDPKAVEIKELIKKLRGSVTTPALN